MNKIELLPLQSGYCEAVAEIAGEALPEHWSLESIRDVLGYDNNIFYVAYNTENREVAGFAGIMVIVDEAELLNIAVRTGYRRKGIGKMLLEQMLQEAVGHGARRMLLEVRRSNHCAIGLYNRYQFAAISERRNYYQDPVEDAIIMEKLLW